MASLAALWPVLSALGLGVIVGAVFGLARLNVPAPGNAAGVAGVAGLWLGWTVMTFILGRQR